jgi:hypothetical protein
MSDKILFSNVYPHFYVVFWNCTDFELTTLQGYSVLRIEAIRKNIQSIFSYTSILSFHPGKLNHALEQNSSWESESTLSYPTNSSASMERDGSSHRSHKFPAPAPILISWARWIRFKTSHPIFYDTLWYHPSIYARLPSGLFSSWFPPKESHLKWAKSPVHLILPDSFSVVLQEKAFALCSSSLCIFLLPFATWIPLRFKYYRKHPVLKYFQPVFLP